MLIRTLTLFVTLIGIALPAYADPSTSAKATMQDTIDNIIRIVEELPADTQKSARRAKLREFINPKFNFAEMSKRSLGSNWTTLTPDQQQEFTAVFSDLLARTYLSKIETVRRGMVTVDSENVELPRAVVKTTVTSKGDKFPIDYKLMLDQGTWQVYDVVIENIGLVANYRNEFAGIMRKDKFEGLMGRLREKARQGA